MTNHGTCDYCISQHRPKLLTALVGNGKRFIAYEIIKRLQKPQDNILLLKMQSMVNNTQKQDNKLNDVFEPSFDWKECRISAFIQQKLNYMHLNPCKGENKIVELPEQYVHSSAKFYITGEQGIFAMTSFMELRDVDLTKRF